MPSYLAYIYAFSRRFYPKRLPLRLPACGSSIVLGPFYSIFGKILWFWNVEVSPKTNIWCKSCSYVPYLYMCWILANLQLCLFDTVVKVTKVNVISLNWAFLMFSKCLIFHNKKIIQHAVSNIFILFRNNTWFYLVSLGSPRLELVSMQQVCSIQLHAV